MQLTAAGQPSIEAHTCVWAKQSPPGSRTHIAHLLHDCSPQSDGGPPVVVVDASLVAIVVDVGPELVTPVSASLVDATLCVEPDVSDPSPVAPVGDDAEVDAVPVLASLSVPPGPTPGAHIPPRLAGCR